MELIGVIAVLSLTSTGTVLLLSGSIFPPTFKPWPHLKSEHGDEDAEVILRWIGVELILLGCILNYLALIPSLAIFFFSYGLASFIGYSMILFTKNGFDWMYRNTEWRKVWTSDKKYYWVDQIYTMRGLVGGILMMSFAILVLIYP